MKSNCGKTYLPKSKQEEAGRQSPGTLQDGRIRGEDVERHRPGAGGEFWCSLAKDIVCLFLPFFEIQNSSESERMCQPSSSDTVLSVWGPSWAYCRLKNLIVM